MRWPERHCACGLEASESGRCAPCELERCSATVETWPAVEWGVESYPSKRERQIAVSGEALRTWLDRLMSRETWEPAVKPAREVA